MNHKKRTDIQVQCMVVVEAQEMKYGSLLEAEERKIENGNLVGGVAEEIGMVETLTSGNRPLIQAGDHRGGKDGAAV